MRSILRITHKVTKLYEIFECKTESCKKKFDTSKKLYDHVYKCHKFQNLYRCPHCPAGCPTPSALKRHIRVHKRIVCPESECGVELDNFNDRRKHLETCPIAAKNKQPAICEPCSQTFASRKELNRHQRCVHPRLVKCSVDGCTKMVQPARLKKHLRESHLNLMPADARQKSIDPTDPLKRRFKCPDCDSCYTSIHSLRKHAQRKHVSTDDEPTTSSATQNLRPKKFVCDAVGCNRRFLSEQKLESHRNWHMHVKPYVCPVPKCLASFCGKMSLQRHLRQTHFTRTNRYTAEQLGAAPYVPNIIEETGDFESGATLATPSEITVSA